MITKYTVGDDVMYRDFDDFYQRYIPAKVTRVTHELDEVGWYTTIDLLTYHGKTPHLSEPHIKLGLRHVDL